MRKRRDGIQSRMAPLQPSGEDILGVEKLVYIVSVHGGVSRGITIHASTKTETDRLQRRGMWR